MYLLITVCLLIVIVYLARAGLNEKRWYEAHVAVEEREADDGVLGDLRNVVAPESHATGNSIDDDDSRIARSAIKMQERTKKLGARFEEQAKKILEKDEGETLFGKMADKVRNASTGENLFTKVQDKVKGLEAGNVLERMASKVSEKADFADRKVQAQRDATVSEEELRAQEKDSFFGRMVDKVNGISEKATAGVERKMEAAREQDDDLLTRMSKKIGGKVNELDDRAIDSSRKFVK